MAKDNTAEKVLELARSQIGATNGDKYVDYYNEITGSHLPKGCAWCACFVTWVMRHAGVPTDSVLNYKGCATASEWFAQRGRFMGRLSGYVPKPGDIIMYEWTPWDKSDGDDHTGIVERVENGKVYTIEGNNGGQCRRDWWSLTNQYISGYCVPLYNIKQEEPEMTYEDFLEYMKRYQKELADKAAAKWAVPAIDYCKENGIMVGKDAAGDFDPYSLISRQEVAQVAMKLDQRAQGGK